jgi:hypothetical protein
VQDLRRKKPFAHHNYHTTNMSYQKYEFNHETSELLVTDADGTVKARVPKVSQLMEGQLRLEDSTVINIVPAKDGGIEGKEDTDSQKLLEATDFAVL